MSSIARAKERREAQPLWKAERKRLKRLGLSRRQIRKLNHS